jgi:signal transduction histidine kinase
MMMQPQNKILAVDDDVIDRTIVKNLLSKDYNLKTASTGEQALEIAADFQPDIILLDVMMPGITGYEVCRQIRADSKLQYAKIIMVSGQTTISERLAGYEAGADDYITKPFDEGELLAKIRVYLRLKSVEEVDRFKTNVLTLLSHEARTPLSSLIGPAEMLMSEEDMDAEEKKVLVELMCSSAKRLYRFFENVMLLSSLKSGSRQLSPASTDLCDLVREAICEVAAKTEERNIKIEEQFGDSPAVCLDRQEMKRVVTMILDNAIRFSPSDGNVTVRVSSDNDDVCLRVTDRGEGIDPEYLPYVFEELSDPNIDHHSQGQGLSLAIARQIVLRHGGTISADSSKGSGATFTVRLPVTVPFEAALCER